jgi:undecaprenyl-diphosphatase
VALSVVVAATMLAAVLVAGLWIEVATGTGLAAWDQAISTGVVHARPWWVARVAVIISDVASPAVSMAVVVVTALGVARRTHRRSPVLVGAGGVIVLAVVDLGLKDLLARPRPPAAGWAVTTHGYSFPSGHALFAVGALLLCAWLVVRYRDGKPVLLLGFGGPFAVAVGVSRVLVGVHYPSDVLAGWAAAVAAVGLIVIAVDRADRAGRTG